MKQYRISEHVKKIFNKKERIICTMNLESKIGSTVTVKDITGKTIRGDVYKILDNTVIVLCGTNSYLVKKKQLEDLSET